MALLSNKSANQNGGLIAKLDLALVVVSFVSWFVLAWMVFFWVPSDTGQGITQRIFYYHVPTAWISFLGFGISLYYAIRYLISRDLQFDIKSASHAISGWVFTTGVIITGPLWAKPIWGDFWNWSDQRLVSFFILWMAYAGYILMRIGMPEPHKRARFSSIFSIIAFLDVPLVYFAIRIWVTPSHPGAVIAGGKKSGLSDPKMGITFLVAMIAFTLMYFMITRLYQRVKQAQIRFS